MLRIISLIIPISLLFVSCNDSDNAADKVQLSKVQKQKAAIEKEIEGLKQERNKLIAITEQSIKQIKVYEKKRLAAERAEQVRIKADEIELQDLYEAKLKKIKSQQVFIWEGYIGKQFDTVKTTKGTTFNDAKVIDVNAAGISYQHSSGVSRIPFSLLGPKIENACVKTFEKQIADLKKRIANEKDERAYIREQAKKKAEQLFEN